jgi:hypothetical protein
MENGMVEIKVNVANEDLAPVLKYVSRFRENAADETIAGKEQADKAYVFLSSIANQLRAHAEWLEGKQ